MNTGDHFHVEYRVVPMGEDATDWEDIPLGRTTYLNESSASTVAWSFMDLQRDVLYSYVKDHRPEESVGYLSSDQDVSGDLVISLNHPVTRDKVQCRVHKCDGELISRDSLMSEEGLGEFLSSLFGENGVTVIEVDSSGAASPVKGNSELNAILKQLLS